MRCVLDEASTCGVLGTPPIRDHHQRLGGCLGVHNHGHDGLQVHRLTALTDWDALRSIEKTLLTFTVERSVHLHGPS